MVNVLRWLLMSIWEVLKNKRTSAASDHVNDLSGFFFTLLAKDVFSSGQQRRHQTQYFAIGNLIPDNLEVTSLKSTTEIIIGLSFLTPLVNRGPKINKLHHKHQYRVLYLPNHELSVSWKKSHRCACHLHNNWAFPLSSETEAETSF